MATLMLVCEARVRPRSAAEFGALAALALVASPLMSFACYFCAMHSPRHLLRTLDSLPEAGRANTLRFVLWPTLATFVMLGVVAWPLRTHAVTPLVMQLVFVSLAALTLPHMLVLAHDRRLKSRGESVSA
jgi:Brp/Blh family beta-carotene 15,15'-monooxygenase